MDEKIFSQRIDFVIDCIDSIKSKQDLAMACIQRDIPFLSSMGTARRLDPSKLEIMELEKTSYDPIAKRMRNWKRKNKIRNKNMGRLFYGTSKTCRSRKAITKHDLRTSKCRFVVGK